MIVNTIGMTISKIFKSNSVLEKTILNHLIVKCFDQNTLALPGMKVLGKIKGSCGSEKILTSRKGALISLRTTYFLSKK